MSRGKAENGRSGPMRDRVFCAAAGALRARGRRDLHRRARRRAARARPRGRPRLGAVQVVSRARACSTQAFLWRLLDLRRPTGARSTSSSRRSSRRTSSATRRSASGSCTSSARRTSSTAPSSASSAPSPEDRALRRQVQELDRVALGRGDAPVRDLGERRRPARALDRPRRRGAAAPAAGAAVPLRARRRLRPLGEPARPGEADRPAARGGRARATASTS